MTIKVCSRCKLNKEHTEFYIGFRRGKHYLFSRCKACHIEINANQKENNRDWELQNKYGITLLEYNKQVMLRNNLCDICNKYNSCLHVDHCHITNRVRGYLCGSCNRGIGLLKDSAEVCYKAYKYLEANEASSNS